MKEKIQKLLKKFHDVEKSLGDPGIHLDQKKFKELTQQHSYLLGIKDTFEKLEKLEKQLQDNKELLAEYTGIFPGKNLFSFFHVLKPLEITFRLE